MVVRNFMRLMSASTCRDKIAVIRMLIASGIGISESDEKKLIEYLCKVQNEGK